MTDNLKPCPFCGGTDAEMQPVVTVSKEGPVVICTACSALGPTRRSCPEAIAAWNTRADQPVSVEARNAVIDTDDGRVASPPGSSSLRSPEPAAPSRPLRGDDPSRAALPCIVCGHVLDGVFPDDVRRTNQPSCGVAFGSPGHYGTRVFDPMNGDALEINICDDCLVRAGRGGAVLHHRAYPGPYRRKTVFWHPPRDSDRSGEAIATTQIDATEGESAGLTEGKASPDV